MKYIYWTQCSLGQGEPMNEWINAVKMLVRIVYHPLVIFLFRKVSLIEVNT